MGKKKLIDKDKIIWIRLELEFKENGIYKLENLRRNNNEGPFKTIIEYIFKHTEKPKIKDIIILILIKYPINHITKKKIDNLKNKTNPYENLKNKNIKGNENKINDQKVPKNNGPFRKNKKWYLIEVKINNKISAPCLMASMPMSSVFAGARSSMEHTVGI